MSKRKGPKPLSLNEVLLSWYGEENYKQAKAILRAHGVGYSAARRIIADLERAQLASQTPSLQSVIRWVGLLVNEEGAEDTPIRGDDYEPEPVETRPEPDRKLVRRSQIDGAKVARGKRILVLDIETVMGLLMVYSIYGDFNSPKNMVYPGRMLCFSAKWVGDPYNTFYFVDRRGGYTRMLEVLWTLLNEAEYVVTWNGNRFDLPKIEGQFLKAGLGRPSPFKSIDLMVTARRLGFESKALDYVGRMLGTSRKVEGAGAAGWKDCLGIQSDAVAAGMAEEELAVDTVRRLVTCDLAETPEMTEAWKSMKAYNKGDILATEDLFFELLPFLKGVAIHDEGCPFCGESDYTFTGYHETPASRWQVRRCAHCTSQYRVGGAERRSTLLTARPV